MGHHGGHGPTPTPVANPVSAQPGRQLDAEIVALSGSWLARRAWLLDLLEFVLTLWPGGGGYEPSGKVVVRYRGRERLLFEEPTFERAKEKVERVAMEFETMSLAAWCARYRVPEDFFADEI